MEIEIVVNNWFYIMIVRPRLFHETETVSDFVKKNMHGQKAEFFVEASSFTLDSNLFKPWSPGVRWGTMRDQVLHINIHV